MSKQVTARKDERGKGLGPIDWAKAEAEEALDNIRGGDLWEAEAKVEGVLYCLAQATRGAK